MKSDTEIVNILYQILQAAPLDNDGDIYKYTRPASKKEDVVINSITNINGYMQAGVYNVNIFVPDNNFPAPDGKTKYFAPDTDRLKELSDAAIAALEDYYSPTGFNFRIENQTTMSDSGNQHFSNIRIRFYNVNI